MIPNAHADRTSCVVEPATYRRPKGAAQPYRYGLTTSAKDILRYLDDGEWHEVGWWRERTLRRLVVSGLAYAGKDDAGHVVAIATDAGLAMVAERTET